MVYHGSQSGTRSGKSRRVRITEVNEKYVEVKELDPNAPQPNSTYIRERIGTVTEVTDPLADESKTAQDAGEVRVLGFFTEEQTVEDALKELKEADGEVS